MTQTLRRTPAAAAPARLRRGPLLLMSAATGLAVAGNHFAQPLLEVIGRQLELSTAMAALIVTAAQGGYALGLILLVPWATWWNAAASASACSPPPRCSCWCPPPRRAARCCWPAPR
ncbi:hypothetical protein [Streptosporangium pseudovulgare]|uniref:Major facilitator superfamily (MFS) profile domain-containing protein n=1 Tax=Streptosporangium pseudovulgare TaxID=35765 RepID=A0ABQ2RJK2_9ACTN|nr:hypothetical protein [Streptosporangium pseudovulgare]GGQ31205.1 hypothetical protein GCM10010140_71550 [Streptosporangium pseudovulgare]